MNHRHLLPNEIDLLVDGEVGFGVAPLLAHLKECADCHREVEEARDIAMMLEELPRFAPSYGLADRVMAQVPVFIPWHVAARDTIRGWIPESRPLRMLALAGGAAFASIFTIAALWLVAQGSLVSFASAAAGDQLRTAVGVGARELLGGLFGEQVFTALAQSGMVGLGLMGGGFVAAALIALLGLRAVAAAGRRQP